MTQLVREGRDGAADWEPMRLFSELWYGDVFTSRAQSVQVSDDGDVVTVTADMPGVPEGSVEVTFEAGVLTMVGKRDDEREYRYTWRPGSDVDPATIGAALENGILTVTARKVPQARPRRIPVVVKGRRRGAKRRFSLFRRRR